LDIDSKELEEYVRATIEGIKKGIPKGFYLSESIKFELAVVNVKKGEGGLKILVVDASGKYEKETMSKISFEIRMRFDLKHA